MSILTKRLLWLVTLMALLVPVAAMAQAISGDLVGTVTDSQNAVVANAKVEATNLATGLKLSTVTTASGEYHFVNLPAGHYSVVATGAGLKGGYKDVEVSLNKTATANITAAVAGADVTVEVSAQAANIDTVTPQIQSSFSSKEAVELPGASTGSGVLNLSLLNAGVASSGGLGAGSGPAVSGNRPRNNNFTIEGVDNNDKSVTGPLVTIPNDAVEEFTVLQNQFSPEFGHSSGGQFNQTIKGGSNSFHGSLYEYFENRKLNAQDTLVATGQEENGLQPYKPRFDDNRFGGQIGGPIIKNKLFFFTNFQYQPHGAYVSGASGILAPTESGYALLNSIYGNSNNLKILQQYAPAAKTAAATACADVACTQNVDLGYISYNGTNTQNTLTTTNSLDYNISDKDQLRLRYVYEKLDATDTSAVTTQFWLPVPLRYHLFTLGEYHNFTPHLNNEFRLGFNRYSNNWSAGSTTFPGLDVFPNLTIDELGYLSIGPDSNAPQFGTQNTYQITDNVSWVKGKHNFKFGGEYRDSISPQSFTQRVRGDYDWAYLSSYLADLAPDDYGERSVGNATYYGNQQSMYLFANDEFRVTPQFTFNIGVRYELTTVPYSQGNFQQLNSISSVPGLVTFGKPQMQKNNFAPRVGFAWSPDKSGNTSIRGGFAMAQDVLYDNLGILSLPPQLQQTCDVGNTTTDSCYWSNTGFLANGGLPSSTPTQFTSAADARAVTGAYIPDQKLPYSETWNLGIQHIFNKNYTLEVRYVGTRGIHLPAQIRLNRQNTVTSSNYLPTYLTNPGSAVLNSLTTVLGCAYDPSNPTACPTSYGLVGDAVAGSYVPSWYNAGFSGANVVGFMPWGGSKYNGLQTQLTRNFSNGLQFKAAWTWSHTFDNSTADVMSTYLTPRRVQDFQNINADWGTSALDRRHRVTIAAIYDLPIFKNSNSSWLKNVVGNWQVAPVLTYETPEYFTVQSGTDSNLNGDSAGDRTIYNAAGISGTASGVTALKNDAGDVVAYLANDPTAQYIKAGKGALATSGRNTVPLPKIVNTDLSLVKKVNITESQNIRFEMHAFNFFNHPQYVAGSLNDILSVATNQQTVASIVTAGSSTFNQPKTVFSSNPRTIQLVLKYNF